MVFQQFNLFPHLTALENVMEGPAIVQRRRKAEVVERGHGPAGAGRAGGQGVDYPRQLSGGQQQRVAIARALAHEARS